MKKFISIVSGIVAVCALSLSSVSVYAQETQPPKPPVQAPKLDSWDSYKQDMKTKQSALTTDVDKLRSEIQEKKIESPSLKAALARFDAEAKAYSDLINSIDQVTPEKREQFKADLNNQYNKLKTAHSQVKTEWEKALNPEDEKDEK